MRFPSSSSSYQEGSESLQTLSSKEALESCDRLHMYTKEKVHDNYYVFSLHRKVRNTAVDRLISHQLLNEKVRKQPEPFTGHPVSNMWQTMYLT